MSMMIEKKRGTNQDHRYKLLVYASHRIAFLFHPPALAHSLFHGIKSGRLVVVLFYVLFTMLMEVVK